MLSVLSVVNYRSIMGLKMLLMILVFFDWMRNRVVRIVIVMGMM